MLSDYLVLRHLNLEIHEGGFFQWSGKKYNPSDLRPRKKRIAGDSVRIRREEEIGDLSPNFPHEGAFPTHPVSFFIR